MVSGKHTVENGTTAIFANGIDPIVLCAIVFKFESDHLEHCSRLTIIHRSSSFKSANNGSDSE